MFLSWIIPAYNEEKRIEKTLFEVDAYLMSKNFPGGYEIIVVDSSSTDNTADLVRKLSSRIPRLSLRIVDNKGKGWAVHEGMLNSSGDMRIFSDADNSVSPDQLNGFIPFLCAGAKKDTCFDVVIGSIEAGGATIEENAQWYRRALGRISKLIIRIVSGLWEIRDTQRGFKLFSKRAAEAVFTRQTIFAWGFDIEVLLVAKRRNFAIKEVPVKWINAGDSKVSIGAYVSTFKELLQIKWNDTRGKYK
ncbi:MAG: glycosyltransferase family 2 protein [Candidatus Sungbacteria bacterium]|nr:glycosyltransferase family 2 protein [Candidatus Sungbacteria bacterium]